MTEPINVPMTPLHQLLQDVTVIRSDVGWMRDEIKEQRAFAVDLSSRVRTIENGRIADESAAKERARMMKWLWTGSVFVASIVASAISFAVNTWIKLGAPHP
jgi:hypothetical protein